MPDFGFIGPAYALESLAAEAQECVNLYLEADESGGGRSKARLAGTPGLALHVTLPKSPVRGLWAGDGRLFAVAGTSLYEVFSGGTYTDRSAMSGGTTLANDGLPVTFAANGTQLLVVSGGNVYCDSGSGPVLQYFSSMLTDQTIGPAANQISPGTTSVPFDSTDVGNTITITGGTGWTAGTYTISSVSGGVATMSASVGTVGSTSPAGFETLHSDGPISASCCAFLDGFFIVAGLNVTTNQSYGPKQFNISQTYDGRIWPVLSFGVKQGYPDNIQFILADHEELWIFGDNYSTEVWRNTGAANFPFERDPSAFIHQALVARFTPVSIANSVAWLGSDTRGGPVAWLAQGYVPVRISTHAIEQQWAAYATVSDAIGYSYMDRGHACWVLTFPTADATWAYDVTTQQWHRRGIWNSSSSSWDRQKQAYHGYEFGKHLVGDYSTGGIYWMDRTLYQELGSDMYFRRTAPYIADELRRIPHNKFRLDMEFTAPFTITLAYSDDQGKTWSAERAIDGLKIDRGDPNKPLGVEWRRLATSRMRLYRVTGYGNQRRSLINAYVNPPD